MSSQTIYLLGEKIYFTNACLDVLGIGGHALYVSFLGSIYPTIIIVCSINSIGLLGLAKLFLFD